MNEFKYPVKEIIQAVEEIQTKKGPIMTPVSDFVRIYRKHLEDPQKDKFVLKTIKTLKKLAEDGTLTKTGKTYMYDAAKCDNEEDDDDDDEEDEDDVDDDDNDEGCNEDDQKDEDEDTGPCCDPGGEEENECDNEDENDCDNEDEEKSGDDDDDEIDEDEEDDDDDIDDDDCKNQESSEKRVVMGNCQKGKEKKNNLKEKGNFQCDSIDNLTLKNAADDSEGRSEGKCIDGRGAQDENIIDSNAEKVRREGETFAFCVRDFIDSLYRARSGSKFEEEFSQMEKFEKMDASEIEKNLKGRKGKFSTKRNKEPRTKYRSRSPLRKNKPEIFNSLKHDMSDMLRCRTINSQYSQEPMDADMENLENDKDIEIEFESINRRSPLGATPSSGFRDDMERRKSVVSIEEQRKASPGFPDRDKILMGRSSPLKMTTAFEVDEIQSRIFNVDADGSSEEDKTKMFFDEDISIKDEDDDKTSFCSHCDETN